ncbi:hypothetical protein VNO80_10817 [Phaseolus coccineus]|uniref:Uncharacterized protein n=1 Tax=Phaseolus coccineus TaxID=3886 RepID=A0AAN9N9A1_PHACN
MPGVLMVEVNTADFRAKPLMAMAQVGGLVMLQPEVGGSRQNFFFAGIDKVRFRKPMIAGDKLVMRMTLTKLQKRFGMAKKKWKGKHMLEYEDNYCVKRQVNPTRNFQLFLSLSVPIS